MNFTQLTSICKKATQIWGPDIQSIVAIEELAELQVEIAHHLIPSCPKLNDVLSAAVVIKQISKMLRTQNRENPFKFDQTNNNQEHIAEEIADCLLMVLQMKEIYVQSEPAKAIYNQKLAKFDAKIQELVKSVKK